MREINHLHQFMWEKVGKAGPFSHQSPAFSQVKPPPNPPSPISARFPPASWQFSRFPVHCLFRIRAGPCSIRGQPITPRLLHSVSPHHSLTPILQFFTLHPPILPRSVGQRLSNLNFPSPAVFQGSTLVKLPFLFRLYWPIPSVRKVESVSYRMIDTHPPSAAVTKLPHCLTAITNTVIVSLE